MSNADFKLHRTPPSDPVAEEPKEEAPTEPTPPSEEPTPESEEAVVEDTPPPPSEEPTSEETKGEAPVEDTPPSDEAPIEEPVAEEAAAPAAEEGTPSEDTAVEPEGEYRLIRSSTSEFFQVFRSESADSEILNSRGESCSSK